MRPGDTHTYFHAENYNAAGGAMAKHFPLSGLVSKARANPSAPTDVLRTDGAMREAAKTPNGPFQKEF